MKRSIQSGRKRIAALLLTLLLFCAAALPVFADIGPKPSVTVHCRQLPGGPCYATLLSRQTSTGPYRFEPEKTAPDEWQIRHDPATETLVWQAFRGYQDPDGYFFIEWFQKLEEGRCCWNYYPPQQFKVLLYFPQSGQFAVSGICERYAFHSCFTVCPAAQQPTQLTVQKSYDYSWELISLAVRILLTIGLELALALLFGWRSGKALRWIMGVNLVTQIGLNLALNLINYRSGPWAFVFWYLVLELAVFVAEALIYARVLPTRKENGKKAHPVLYAAAANTISFAAGMALARYIPGIF